MCKRHIQAPASSELPAEGPTIRLDRRTEAMAESGTGRQRRTGHCQSHWWLLWMIWPLSGLFKWLAPQLESMLATIGQVMLSLPLLVSIVLIVVGLVLLRRS